MKLDILKKLVSIDTVADNNNGIFIEFVSKILINKKFNIEYIKNENGKSCLIAKKGNYIKLCFMGHCDTVPVTSCWNTNPYELTVKDDIIYGLGVCDMKGGISAFLTAIEETKTVDGIMVIITYDEEVGFEGIKLIKNRKDIPENIIIAEPTDMVPIAFCKGCIEYKVSFIGKSVHASLKPKGRNAILNAIDFISELKKIENQMAKDKNDKFSIPFTTMNLATINGGTAINIVPDNCEITFDFRTICKEHHTLIEKQISELGSNFDCKINLMTNVYPVTNKNSKKLKELEKITKSKVEGVNYVTEGNFLNRNNVVILGPGPITAHEPNEHISLGSYNKAINVFKKIISKYCEEIKNE